MRTLIFVLILFSMLLAGCQPAVAPAAATQSPIPLPTAPPADPRLSLQPCKVYSGTIDAECGFLHVPEDRANPSGRTLDLGIVVVRAQQADGSPDPLFYLAGGPGGAATSSGMVINVRGIFKDINAQRDMVFLDQRGTNDRHRLACDWPSFSIADASQQQVDGWMKECLSGLDGDPRFYTTAEAMRDLDAAREALGYDKINLYGISYGAAAVQVYMRLFPDHVRSAVMDHGTALDLPFFQAFPRASQAALDQIFTYCEQDEQCRTKYPDIRRDWQAVRSRLAKGPVVTSYTPPGADAPAQVDMNGLANALHNMMYSSGTYVQIPYLVHTLATSEDWTPVVKTYAEHQVDSNGSGDFLFMANTIFCFEPAWGDEPEPIARLNPNTYITDLQVQNAQFQQKICAALPKPDASLIYGPGKPAPISALILNSRLDPQNPPSNMEPALKEFTKSRLVVEPTEGHDTSASSCRWGIITQYIEQGSAEDLDTVCLEERKPNFVSFPPARFEAHRFHKTG